MCGWREVPGVCGCRCGWREELGGCGCGCGCGCGWREVPGAFVFLLVGMGMGMRVGGLCVGRGVGGKVCLEGRDFMRFRVQLYTVVARQSEDVTASKDSVTHH